MFFGLGPKTIELFKVMEATGAALTQKQCDALCRTGIYRLQDFGVVKRCPTCRRWEIDQERLDEMRSAPRLSPPWKEESHV